ncbi:MAG: polysaccharide biosynthesis protein [Candidatus Omnitrophica bacterium]|nr:polysaccharide biosynthesis protein [Candidatus Omnitrophota bacterium]
MEILKGKKILIIGGAGSVGFALAKDILKFSPATVRLLDISENEMSKVRSDLGNDKRVRYLIGDIRDIGRLKLAMEDIDIVIHLAAMKHVYACEYNPFEAIKTNIDGLQNVIDIARDGDIEKMIFASTDKAVSPTSVMGMTKLLGEKLVSLANYYQGKKRTVFSSIRFGNVIGSNGSVAPLFKKQISVGRPLTITDEAMSRFVITMDEAIRLIYSAIKIGKGGEVFVWKMRTVRVVDLARAMIVKYAAGKKIKIQVIGKCEGEKIHEEIMTEGEVQRAVELDNLYIVFPAIDHQHLTRKYINAKKIKNPIVVSNQGTHMSENEIKNLLEELVISNGKNFTD